MKALATRDEALGLHQLQGMGESRAIGGRQIGKPPHAGAGMFVQNSEYAPARIVEAMRLEAGVERTCSPREYLAEVKEQMVIQPEVDLCIDPVQAPSAYRVQIRLTSA
jgi:hypothetical protein